MIRTMISSFLLLLALTAPAAPGQDLNQQAVVTTSEGTFVLSFYPDKAPRHVALFLKLAADGAYDGAATDAETRHELPPLAGDPIGLAERIVPARLHGLGARLDDVELAAPPVHGPFNVHGHAVMPLDGRGGAGAVRPGDVVRGL